ncbi:MAG: beta-ketoacyl-[acyl-carrier-protein] synthase family protein [Magnetococcus sp. DMHC-6]
MANIKISGYGAVTPLGANSKISFKNLLMGKDAFKQSTFLDLSDDFFYQKKIAEISEHILDHRFGDHNCFATVLTMLALNEAYEMAGSPNLSGSRVGIAISTLESQALENIVKAMEIKDDQQLNRSLHYADSQYCVTTIRRHTGAQGPSIVLSNACASGNHAIAAGYDMIETGEVDIAIVGGGCKIFQSAVVGFHQFTGVSGDTCRPFDRNRSGTMLGDGAGILIIESADHAKKRGHCPRIELLGYGVSCDSYDMMAPHPEGLGMELAMRRSLTMANISSNQIQYINAHGTGTTVNDKLESISIHRVFGEQYLSLPISSTKSMIGHALYAASALEAVWCCRVLDENMIPPTANFQTKDDECPIDCVPNQARHTTVDCCMNNSFGFGGTNATVIFRKCHAR